MGTRVVGGFSRSEGSKGQPCQCQGRGREPDVKEDAEPVMLARDQGRVEE